MFVVLSLLSQAMAAPISHYDPAIHDLYQYDATVTKADPATPVAYNTSAIPDGYDFTGVNVRDRRFNNRSPHVSSSTDINDYNSGYVAIVMVSPQHALVSAHYIDAVPSQMNAVEFMADDGHKVVLEGVSSDIVGPDLKLITFSEPLPEDAGIAVYSKFIDYATLPVSGMVFGVDSQGRMLPRRAVHYWEPYNEEWSFVHTPFGPITDHLGVIFSGDSGTPLFIADYTGQNYFLGTAYDSDRKIGPEVVANINALTALSGYSVEQVDYPYAPVDFDLDGRVTSADLSLLLGAWGTSDETADVNGDGVVDGGDFGVFLGYW
ncbi:MAG TPA: hypothetical protein DFR83_17790 [Deltaproteobacteria bacterium]|nr:hypothetical protein [Deltaproteobacteria bacterium]